MTLGARLAAVVVMLLAGPALAQGIDSTPLPPPGGTVAAPPTAATPLVRRRPPAPSVLAPPVVAPRPAPLRRKPVAVPATPGAAKIARPLAARPVPAKAAPVKTSPAKPAVAAKAAAAAAAAAAATAAPVTPAVEPPKIDPTKGTATGLPLPRWAAFRSDEVNLRSGPGMQYPIDWVYHRRDLPVQIEREFEVWRLVEDQDGTKGWVHQATLTGRRGFLVLGPDPHVLRAAAAETAAAVAELKPGVVGSIRGCAAGAPWCEVQTGSYRGWLKRTELRGVDADEAVGN